MGVDKLSKVPDSIKQAEIDWAWEQHNLYPREYIATVRRKWLEKHLESQGHTCAYCAYPIRLTLPNTRTHPHAGKATIDHVIALSKDGPDEFDNTVAACSTCNNDKADMSVEEFKASPRHQRRLVMVASMKKLGEEN